MAAEGTGPVEALEACGLLLECETWQISSDEPLERLGVQVKPDNVGLLGQQSFPTDLSRVVACAGSQGVRASCICL